MKRIFIVLGVVFSMGLAGLTARADLSRGYVELHAHLFMKEGMSWMFKGDFNGPLRAWSWKNRFSSQINPGSLAQSGLDIVVATLYAHPLTTFSMRDSVRRQLGLARRFVTEHPEWILAFTPDQARRALMNGKKVVILALEGASGILETEIDLKEFIDDGGIRIVTLLHLTDDQFGGVAFLGGIRALSSPFAWIENLFAPRRDAEGNRTNAHGLTEKGRTLAAELMARHVWLDLSHASDESQIELSQLATLDDRPWLNAHTVLRKYHHAERGITLEQLRRVAASRGIVGLMPSEEMLAGTPALGDCLGGVHALAVQYREVAAEVGRGSVTLGSDFNGGISHLKPSACPSGTSLDEEGLWNIGQTADVWSALTRLGVYEAETGEKTPAGKFLKAWSRVFGGR